MSKNIHHFMAGDTILEFTYRVCADFQVPRSEIAELLLDLSMAVAVGQAEPKPVVAPEPPQLPLDTRIRELWAAGKRKCEIAKELHCHWSTVHDHVKRLPEPQSDPASVVEQQSD